VRVGSLTESAELGLALLRRLSTSLADALTIDEIARATLDIALQLPDVHRAGIALTSGGGRELQFVSTDEEVLAPNRVQWCLIDGFSDVPLVDAVRHGQDVYVDTVDDLDRRYPTIAARQRSLGTQSLAALALATDTQHVGGLLLSFEREQDFDSTQRWLHSALAAQVAQAFRKGLALQAQQTTAEQLQRSLMPRSLPDLAALSLGSQ
jgi:GAF domain-containing protein